MADARNKSTAGLETALLDAFKAKIAKAVAAGKLDNARAQKLVAAAPAVIHRLMTHAPKARPAKANVRSGFLKVAADYLGLDRKALAQELRSGKSLAQVATAKNKSRRRSRDRDLQRLQGEGRQGCRRRQAQQCRRADVLRHAPALIERVVNAHR